MKNPYLIQLAAKRNRYGTMNNAYGEEDLFYDDLEVVSYGEEKSFGEGLKKAGMMVGGILLGVGALIAAPSIYTKFSGRTPEQALGLTPRGGKNYGGFNKHLPLEDRIESLLTESKKQLHKNKSVDKIVGSFAMAQELIHTDEFTHDYEHNPRKKQIVEEFTDYGMELSK